MGKQSERGTSLIETIVAVAIVAIVAGAFLSAETIAARFAGARAIADVLQDASQRELRIALDVLKYRGSNIVPASVATSLPMPTGSPLPVQLSVSSALLTGGAISVTITAAAADGSGRTASTNATLVQRAPLPGTRLRAPLLAPAPTGAP